MKRIMKRNQVVITALAVMLAVAGYLTYAGKQDLNRAAENQLAEQTAAGYDYDTYVAGTLNGQEVAAAASGEAAGGSGSTSAEQAESGRTEAGVGQTTAGADGGSDAQAAEEQGILTDIDSMDYDIDDPGEAVLANGVTVSDYLAAARLNREQVRGKSREDLLKIIDDEAADSVSRQAAVDKMVELTDNSDRECAAETLLSAKGFDNSIVSITDGKVDVVICKSELSDAELAQIEDIVKRKADVSAAQIVISLMDVSE